MSDEEMPALEPELLVPPAPAKLGIELKTTHKPRILLLDGSIRER